LFCHSLHDILSGYLVGAHPVGLQPDPHRIRAVAEIPGETHALDSLEPRHDVDVGEVEQELLIDVWIRTVEVHIHQHAWHDLADEEPLPYHQGRETVQYDVAPVLHVHDRHVRVRARLEVDPDRCLTGTGGVRGNVTHILDAVDGLLQRNQDRIDQDGGT